MTTPTAGLIFQWDVTAAQRYAAKFATWRARMPLPMRDPDRNTQYWLEQLRPRPRRWKPETDLADVSADPALGMTHYERRSAEAFQRLVNTERFA